MNETFVDMMLGSMIPTSPYYRGLGPAPTDVICTHTSFICDRNGDQYPVVVNGYFTDYHNGEGLQEWRVTSVMYKGVDVWPLLNDLHTDHDFQP